MVLARAGNSGPALNRHWVDVWCLLGIVVGDLATDTGPLSRRLTDLTLDQRLN